MKDYVKKALKELESPKKSKITITLKNKDDYKRNPFRIAYNTCIFKMQQLMVPSHFKNWLLRTAGLKVGRDACIPHYIKFDPYFPELIHLGDGCILGGCADLVTHEIRGKNLLLGKIIQKPRTLIGGLGIIYPGSIVNQNSILGFFSDLDTEIPEGELWSGRPAKFWKKMTKDEIDKYFKPSNGKHKEYYKEFYKQVKVFVKDPEQNYFKMHYDGNRLNAGSDWWRARNIFRIYYGGILAELGKRMPNNFLRKLCCRMQGVKLGKNVEIGKGVIFDHLYPDLNTVGDNVKIGDEVYFDNHSYTISQTVFGKNKVGNNVEIGSHTHIVCGASIGDNATIEPNSVVQREVPSNVVWGGTPVAKLIRKKKKGKD
jgi:acetyltransferase-like isoleucine patch superfamily enzyme